MLRPIDKKMIEKAKKYPFNIPSYSYIFVNGDILKLIEFNPESVMDCIIQVNDERQKLRRFLNFKKINLNSDFSSFFPYSCLWIKCIIQTITREIFKF
jgi:hypothetical protein